MGLALCNCRQTRSTEVGISPGPSRCKDGGRGVVMMGVDIRGGVMLWINMKREVPTERCLTVAGSMHCRSKSSRWNQTGCWDKWVEIRIPQVTFPLLMSSSIMNQITTRVKRSIGAANSSKKQIKKNESRNLTSRIGRHWECSYGVGIVSQEWWAVNTGVSLF